MGRGVSGCAGRGIKARYLLSASCVTGPRGVGLTPVSRPHPDPSSPWHFAPSAQVRKLYVMWWTLLRVLGGPSASLTT